MPGDGPVDYPAVFHALGHYSGRVVIEAEQDPAKADSKEYAALGFANLKRFLSEAGLTGVAA